MARIVYSPLPRRRRDPPKRVTPLPAIVRAKRARSINLDARAAENRSAEDVFGRLVAGSRPKQAG